MGWKFFDKYGQERATNTSGFGSANNKQYPVWDTASATWKPRGLIYDSGFLGASQASFDVSGIDQSGTNLRYMLWAKSTGASTLARAQCNADATTANYMTMRSEGHNGSGSMDNSLDNSIAGLYCGYCTPNNAAAPAFTVGDIGGYSDASHKKPWRWQGGGDIGSLGYAVYMGTALWAGTAAITRITIVPDVGSFDVGSRLMLYVEP